MSDSGSELALAPPTWSDSDDDGGGNSGGPAEEAAARPAPDGDDRPSLRPRGVPAQVPEVLRSGDYRLERYDCSTLTVKHFREVVVFGQNPAIIAGLAPHLRGHERDRERYLSLDFLRAHLDPDMEVHVRQRGAASLGEFFEHLQRHHDDPALVTGGLGAASGGEGACAAEAAKDAHFKCGLRMDNVHQGVYVTDMPIALH